MSYDALADTDFSRARRSALEVASAALGLNENLIDEFFFAGGNLVPAPPPSDLLDPSCHFKIVLCDGDFVFPVSATGLHRGQVLHRFLADLAARRGSPRLSVAAPHGAEEGLDPLPARAAVTPATRDLYVPVWDGSPDNPSLPLSPDESLHEAAFAAAFGAKRTARFGSCAAAHLAIHAPSGDEAPSTAWRETSEARHAMRSHFDRMYWAARGIPRRRRRVYVCLGACTGSVVSRLLEACRAHDASLENVAVLGIPLDGVDLRGASAPRHVARARRAGHAAATPESVLARAYRDCRDTIAAYFHDAPAPAPEPVPDPAPAPTQEPEPEPETEPAPARVPAPAFAIPPAPAPGRSPSALALATPEPEPVPAPAPGLDRSAAFARIEGLARAAADRDRNRDRDRTHSGVALAPKPAARDFLALVPGQHVDFRDYNGRYYRAEVAEVHPRREELVVEYDVELLGRQRRHILLAYSADYDRVEVAGAKTGAGADPQSTEASRARVAPHVPPEAAALAASPASTGVPGGAPVEAEAAEAAAAMLQGAEPGDELDVRAGPGGSWVRAVVAEACRERGEVVVEFAGRGGRTRERAISTRLRPGLAAEVAPPGKHALQHRGPRPPPPSLATTDAARGTGGSGGAASDGSGDGGGGSRGRFDATLSDDDGESKGDKAAVAAAPETPPMRRAALSGASTAVRRQHVTTPGGRHLDFAVGDALDYLDYDGLWHAAAVTEVKPSKREMFVEYRRASGARQRRHVMLDFSVDVKRLAPSGAYTGASRDASAPPPAAGSTAHRPSNGGTGTRNGGAGTSGGGGGALTFEVGDEVDFQDYDGTWQPARVEEVSRRGKSIHIVHHRRWGRQQRRHLMLDLGSDLRRLAPRGAFTTRDGASAVAGAPAGAPGEAPLRVEDLRP